MTSVWRVLFIQGQCSASSKINPGSPVSLKKQMNMKKKAIREEDRGFLAIF